MEMMVAAVSDNPMAEKLLSKRVQEMVINNNIEEPPQPYVSRVQEEEDPPPMAAMGAPPLVPIIDLSRIKSSSEEEESKDELYKIKAALSSWGCFQAIGQGISSSLLDEIRKIGREFFELAMDEKKKYAKTVHEFEGYGADPVPEQGQFLDWSDRLFLTVFPQDQRKYQFWPNNPHSFRGIVEEYMEKMKELTEFICKAMAKSLNLDENCFLEQFGDQSQFQIRFNYYSPCKWSDRVLGLKPHSDSSGFTIIMEDEQGLQVLKDDKWFNVPNNPHSILVLMGDQMQIMSNGILKSPVHRVLSNSERDRISVAVFYTPEVGKEIEPQNGLINEENPKLFKKIKDYADIYFPYYQKGQRAIHTAQL